VVVSDLASDNKEKAVFVKIIDFSIERKTITTYGLSWLLFADTIVLTLS